MFFKNLTIFAISCVLLSSCMDSEAQCINEKDLKRDLLLRQDYDKDVRPVLRSSDIIIVNTDLTLAQLTNVDENEHLITFTSWLRSKWYDPYLRWNPVKYGTHSLVLPLDKVWTPEFGIIEASYDTSTFIREKKRAMIDAKGKVFWASPFTTTVACPQLTPEANRAECSFTLISVFYDANQVILDLLEDNLGVNTFLDTNPEWRVIGKSFFRQKEIRYFESRPYSALKFTIKLARRPS